MHQPTLSSDLLASETWQALGSTVALRLSAPGRLEPACAAVERELDAIDRACSRFRADSELSHINARAGRSTEASPLMIEALELALRAADVVQSFHKAAELHGLPASLL